MSRILSRSWFALSFLAGLALLYSLSTPLEDETPSLFADVVLPAIATSLRIFSFGLVYLLIERAAPNARSRQAGWMHLVAVGSAIGVELAAKVFLDADDADLQGLSEMIAGLARVIGGGSFMLAVVFAIRNAPTLLRRESFRG